MKIGFYCYDNAAGDAMAILAKAAEELGHRVVLFPKQVRGYAAAHADEMADCDVVVMGLSSFQAQEELNLIRRLDGVKWVVFEDVPGVCMRPLVKEMDLVWRADLVLLASPTVADLAKMFGYKCNLVYLGPPPQWRKEYETLMAAIASNKRMEMVTRNRRGQIVKGPLGDGDHEVMLVGGRTVIGLIGGKDPVENNRVINIVAKVVDDMGAVIAFGEHPGEKAERKDDMSDDEFEAEKARFGRLFAEREEMLRDVWVADVSGWKGVQLAAAVDVMVYASGTNISIAGAFARRPAVYLDDESVRARLAKQTGGDGSWFVAELGGAIKAKTGEDLLTCIRTALSDSGKEELRRKQEVAFPMPEDWHTEIKIIRALEDLVKQG
jgi:hypothetical protein